MRPKTTSRLNKNASSSDTTTNSMYNHEHDSAADEEANVLFSAAFQSRLPFDKMTDDECKLFLDVIRNGVPYQRMFIYIRNRILHMWLENPTRQLCLSDVISKFVSDFCKNYITLICRIFVYLERYCYINFGIFKRITEVPIRKKAKIVVVGAGVAGLGAARQLEYLGFDVIVLEARDRIGGRIATFRKNNFIADLGAMVITGLGGNPVGVIQKQIKMDLLKVKPECSLYDFNGRLVPRNRDDVIEKEFNRILDTTSFLAHNLQLKSNCLPSLGSAIDVTIKLQEHKTKVKFKMHLSSLCKVCDELVKFLKVKDELLNVEKAAYEAWKTANESRAATGNPSLYCVRVLLRKLRDIRNQIQINNLKIDELFNQFISMEKSAPPEVYLNSRDWRILNWHFANLEFANATPLQNLSLRNWDQDDDYEFSGNHMIVQNGFSCMTAALSQGLDIELNHAVRRIRYGANAGVEVTCDCLNGEQTASTTKQIMCDAVLITVPLGVLKDDSIQFEPPLPSWKQLSIRNLGFGNLNKVILCFEKVFWEPSVHLFGHIASVPTARGEYFLFWNIYKQPVLLALIAGEAADIIEETSDEIVVARCLAILKTIFGISVVPTPVDAIVTRWKSDQWSRGCYSFVSCDASGDDYDQLAKPVCAANSNIERIFFAGEHTNRNYPATVHGSYMSGLREVQKISETFLGPLCDD